MQLEELLVRLQTLSEADFEWLVVNYVDHVEVLETVKAGGGWLNFNMEFVKTRVGKNFLVQVSAHDEPKKQEFVFVHEVLHIALIVKGYGDVPDEQIYRKVEEELDTAAEALCRTFPELIHTWFSRLVRAL